MTGNMTIIEAWLMCTLFLLLGLLTGYAVGRRNGRQEGLVEGLAFAPLDLHRASLERGLCALCGTKSEIGVNSAGECIVENETNSEVITMPEETADHRIGSDGSAPC